MAQQFRTSAALTEDPGSIPSTDLYRFFLSALGQYPHVLHTKPV